MKGLCSLVAKIPVSGAYIQVDGIPYLKKKEKRGKKKK